MKENKPSSPTADKKQQQMATESEKAQQSGAAKDPAMEQTQSSIQKRQQKLVHRQDGKQ